MSIYPIILISQLHLRIPFQSDSTSFPSFQSKKQFPSSYTIPLIESFPSLHSQSTDSILIVSLVLAFPENSITAIVVNLLVVFPSTTDHWFLSFICFYWLFHIFFVSIWIKLNFIVTSWFLRDTSFWLHAVHRVVHRI